MIKKSCWLYLLGFLYMSSPANAGDEMLNTLKTGDLLSVQSQLGEGSGGFDALGNSALHLAVSSGRNDIVLALIEAGADPNAQNIFGLSPTSWLLK